MAPGTDFVVDSFSVDWSKDNLSTLHLLCTSFLLLLHNSTSDHPTFDSEVRGSFLYGIRLKQFNSSYSIDLKSHFSVCLIVYLTRL